MQALRRVILIPATLALVAATGSLAVGCSRTSDDSSASSSSVSSSVSGSGTPSTAKHADGDGGQTTVAADKSGRSWATAAAATITPGTQTYTEGAGQCTSNYVFTDDAGNVYLGQAAHCATTGKSDQTNGCSAGSLPVGTAVTFNRQGSPMDHGATIGSGQLVYSSWLAMQKDGEKDQNVCAYNDFALIKIADADVGKVNPSLPYWGGPVGINTSGTSNGDRVYSYGNSSLRGGIPGLSPQTGESKADDSATGGWTHELASPTPGIPGDSGSAFLDRDGRALGTLSTLGVALPIVNNVGDISRELAYARAHSGISGLRLVLGTEKFDANR